MLACVTALPDARLVGGAARGHGRASSAAPGLARLVAAGTSVSALGISFGMMVTTPRYLSALAAGERTLFGLERMSASGVPLRALAVTWLVVATIVSLGELGELFVLSSIAVLMQFGTSALALLVLAWRARAEPASAPGLAGRADARGGRDAGGPGRDSPGGVRLRSETALVGLVPAAPRAAACSRRVCGLDEARGDLALSGEVDGGRAARRGRAASDGIAGDRIVQVWDERNRILTARTQPRLLAHHATIGDDGEPRVDGLPWTDPEVTRRVEAAAGGGARLRRFEGVERFDVRPLLVATDGSLAAFGRDRQTAPPQPRDRGRPWARGAGVGGPVAPDRTGDHRPRRPAGPLRHDHVGPRHAGAGRGRAARHRAALRRPPVPERLGPRAGTHRGG